MPHSFPDGGVGPYDPFLAIFQKTLDQEKEGPVVGLRPGTVDHAN